MKEFAHLNAIQLSAYSEKNLGREEAREIGRHLLKCAACRAALPAPSARSFLSVLIGGDELTENQSKNKTLFPSIGFILTISAFFRRPFLNVWGSAVLILVLGLSVLLWLKITKPSGSNAEIARTFAREDLPPDFESGKIDNFQPPPIEETGKRLSAPKPESRNAAASSVSKPLSRINSARNDENRRARKNVGDISSVRGITAPCTSLWKIESALSAEAAKIVFRWKKVSRAAKYHLYISDDNEILIDEFETERETEYVLKKSIDPQRTYKWKIIVTLENGETVVGDSRIIKPGETAANRANHKITKSKLGDVRCRVKSNE